MKQQMLFHYPGCWNPLHDRLYGRSKGKHEALRTPKLALRHPKLYPKTFTRLFSASGIKISPNMTTSIWPRMEDWNFYPSISSFSPTDAIG
uniref:Uncharacterized protein n=1 Tax=Candidatus Kentrum sp. MB TaxID=2138164 RepID=A0A451BA09_9GAMM|nr:MAG: hypothetical protein BECKMB1821G_GA0114241_101653 [Candidatus Kentron sp. MB]VFK27266.1 MAG: hypothetical protein BECKMB1821I_GA0114274_1002104 [Candidatus Kentron sp. MB]VFK75116.1 MAG: hypothetical protein BECKMB1821H_GA0114242_101553 [Candidatus Kentron sp. MB]